MPFYITETGRFYCRDKHFTLCQDKKGYILILTLGGEAEITFYNEEKQILRKNSIVLLKTDLLHHYKTSNNANTNPTKTWNYYWVHFHGDGINGFLSLLNRNIIELSDSSKIVKNLKNIEEIANLTDALSTILISQYITNIITQLVLNLPIYKNTLKNNKSKDMEIAIDFIKENYNTEINIEDITSKLNISKFHFLRLFNKFVGTTPYNYLLHYRINESKKMICTTNLSISAVSEKVGFKSESNFISQFKKITGTTPSKFRTNNPNYDTVMYENDENL